ncbi:MAG: ribosome recycling factor [Patescibacteria group bacterium]|jgi:ribosome recycling factor
MSQPLQDFEQKCEKIITLFTEDLNTVKTGRARPSLVEHIKVNAYGTWMEVRELASISAPDAQTIEISPWDKSIIKDIAKGLATSEARVNPVVQGELIRITIPALTEESRKELVKLIGQKLESHKTMVRQERVHAKQEIEDQKGESGVSEDDIKADLEKLQKTTDKTIERLETLAKEKEAEVMRV